MTTDKDKRKAIYDMEYKSIQSGQILKYSPRIEQKPEKSFENPHTL